MGSIDLGGLFSSLTLDDSQFREALKAASGYSRVFSVDVEKVGTSVGELSKQLINAGISTKTFQAYLNSLRKQGMDTTDAVQVLVQTIAQLQQRISQITSQQLSEAPKLVPNLNEYQRSMQAIQEYVGKLAQTHTKEAKEAAEAAVKYEQDKTAALSKLRQQDYEDKVRRDTDYANLVKQLQKEEVAAAERAEQEKQRAIETAAKQAAQAERERYFEHRRMMQVASAAAQIGVTAGALGAAGLAADFVTGKEAAQFQDEMAKALAVIGDVSKSMRDDLANAAREAAKATGLAAKDIAGDLAVLKKGGIDAADSIKLLPELAKYAVATNIGLHDSTKQALTVMEAFGLKASELPRVLNVLTVANQTARGSVDQLATALEGRSGAALRSANVSLEESAALMTVFARRGFEASAAQTALAQVVNRLTYLARQHGDIQVKLNGQWTAFKDVVYSADGSIRPLTKTLVDLNQIMSGGSAVAVGKFFDAVHMGTTRGVDAVKALTAAAAEAEELTTKFNNAGSALNDAFNIRMQSPLQQLELLKRRFQDLAITIGTPMVTALTSLLDAAKPIIDVIAQLVTQFSQLPQSAQLIVAGLAIIVPACLSAAGGILTLSGHMVRLYADMKLLAGMEGFEGLAAKVTGVEGALTKLSGLGVGATFIGIASAVTGAVLAFYKLNQELDRLQGRYGQLDADFQSYISKQINSADTVRKVTTAQAMVKEALDAGSISANQYAQAVQVLDDKLKNLQKTELSNWTGLKLKVQGKDDPISKDPNEAAKERASLFSQLGLKDYELSIKQAKQALAEALAAGILNPAQAEFAREGIRKMEEEYANLGQTVKAVTATNIEGTNALKLQFDVIKKEYTDAHRAMVNVLAAAAEGKAMHPESVEVPTLLNNSHDQLNLTVEKTKEWWMEFARVGDELKKINTELVKEGRARPEGPDGEIQRIEAYAKFHGIKIISQTDLDQSAAYARDVLQQLYDFQARGGVVAAQTVYSAQVAFIEAEARKLHESAQEYAASIGEDYNQLRRQVDDSVKAGNTAWRSSINEIGRGFRAVALDIAGGIANLLPIFNKQSGSNPLQPLVESFRSAYEKLNMYADPKGALTNVIESIQKAGDISKANAIAVKYFGETAGPTLARELRDGTLAAKDISAAVDMATASTIAYGEQSNKQVSAVAQLWQKAVKDIVQLITKQLIEYGFKVLIDWIFKVGNSTSKLGDDMIAAVSKIGKAIGGLLGIGGKVAGAAASTAGAVVPDIAANGLPAALGGIIPAVPGIAGTATKAAGGAASTVSSTLSTLSGIANIANLGVSIASGIVSGIQGAHTNNLLGEIEISTRGSLNEALNLRRDIWDQHYGLLAKFDMIFNRLGDIWATLMGQKNGGSATFNINNEALGQIAYNTGLILSKYDTFIVPGMGRIVELLGGGTLSVAGGAGEVFNFNGPVTIQTMNAETFVSDLKRKRQTLGR